MVLTSKSVNKNHRHVHPIFNILRSLSDLVELNLFNEASTFFFLIHFSPNHQPPPPPPAPLRWLPLLVSLQQQPLQKSHPWAPGLGIKCWI